MRRYHPIERRGHWSIGHDSPHHDRKCRQGLMKELRKVWGLPTPYGRPRKVNA